MNEQDREVARVRTLLEEGSQMRDADGEVITDTCVCGVCGRSWNDAVITSLTPTPAGRCPFERAHDDS